MYDNVIESCEPSYLSCFVDVHSHTRTNIHAYILIKDVNYYNEVFLCLCPLVITISNGIW